MRNSVEVTFSYSSSPIQLRAWMASISSWVECSSREGSSVSPSGHMMGNSESGNTVFSLANHRRRFEAGRLRMGRVVNLVTISLPVFRRFRYLSSRHGRREL